MKIVIQRVSQANVSVNNKISGKINKGLLLLVGIQAGDIVQEFAEKILKLRIFADENNKMNLSVTEIKGDILVIPQFTLLAEISGGNRPYFGNAAPPEIAKLIFNNFIAELRKSNLKVEVGIFGAKMEVSLINDGPVTIVL